MRVLFFNIILCLSLFELQAQDMPNKQLQLNPSPSAKLFVHFDKNVYSSNEMVWFTAYLLEEQAERIDLHTVLAVSLIEDSDSTIVLQEKFVMGQGLSFGNLVIPNLLPNGNYHFMVFTNVVAAGKPAVVFIQRITLKTIIIPTLKANISFQKKPSIKDKEANLLFKVTTSEDKLLPKAAEVTYQLGNFKGKGKTDTFGQLAIAIPFTAIKNDSIVNVKVKYEKDSALVNIALPVFKRRAKMSFYPEGGYLVDQIPGYVSFEIKDQFGQPLQTQAILFKDNSPIDTLQSNYYGMGKFALVPEIKSSYSVKLFFDKLTDSTYLLPQIIANGVAVSMNNAVATDTISLTIRGNLNGKYYLKLHNYITNYANTPIILKNIVRLKIPLERVPKGLFTLTLSDSLGKPLAERMAFAHYDTKENLQIETNKATYKPREKVRLKLSLDSALTAGIFSIAVVQQSRINNLNKTDIQSYSYIESELGNLPVNAMGNAYKDKAFLEDMLRVKGWSRYTWLKQLETKPIDKLQNYANMDVVGTVSKNGKPLTKPVSLGITIDTMFNIMQTDTTGKFMLSTLNMVAESGKKGYVFLNGGNKEILKVNITDPYITMAENNKKPFWPTYTGVPVKTNNFSQSLNSGQSIMLNEVTINGEIKNERLGLNNKIILGANACGDYLCVAGVLNCPYHSPATSPIKGKTYAVVNKSNKKGYDIVIYKGCLILERNKESSLIPIPLLYLAKEFYNDDDGSNNEPKLSTTIYWTHYVKVNNNSIVDLNFQAGDILGNFQVVIQGLIDSKPLYKSFDINITSK